MAQKAYKDGRRRARTFHDLLLEVSGRPRPRALPKPSLAPEDSPWAFFGSRRFSPSLVWLRNDEHIVFMKRQHSIEAGAVYKGSNEAKPTIENVSQYRLVELGVGNPRWTSVIVLDSVTNFALVYTLKCPISELDISKQGTWEMVKGKAS